MERYTSHPLGGICVCPGVEVAESILRSLNAPESDIDERWAILAEKRLVEVRSGHVKPVSGTEVFERIWQRFDS